MARIDHAALAQQIAFTTDALTDAQKLAPGAVQDNSTEMQLVRQTLNGAGYALQAADAAMQLVIAKQQEEAHKR